jgi:RNA polymerase sigma-70 factor (ECF subfamily)
MDEIDIQTDKKLLRRLRNGDEKAFEQIYQDYSSALIGFAGSRLETLAEAKDVVQDVFMSLWIKREVLQINVSLQSYLYTAIRYKVIDHIRKNVQRDYYAKAVSHLKPQSENTVYDDIFYKELNGLMDSEIGKLPLRTREVFLMSRKRHLSIAEIATQLNVSEQTVKNQLTTALKKLRPALSKLAVFASVFFY